MAGILGDTVDSWQPACPPACLPISTFVTPTISQATQPATQPPSHLSTCRQWPRCFSRSSRVLRYPMRLRRGSAFSASASMCCSHQAAGWRPRQRPHQGPLISLRAGERRVEGKTPGSSIPGEAASRSCPGQPKIPPKKQRPPSSRPPATPSHPPVAVWVVLAHQRRQLLPPRLVARPHKGSRQRRQEQLQQRAQLVRLGARQEVEDGGTGGPGGA